MSSAGKGISLSVFLITVILVAIIAGALGYFLKPTPAAPAGATQTVTSYVTTTQTITAAGPKPGAGMTIYWIGGAAGDPFDARLYRGAMDAAELLGVKLVYVHTAWDPDKMVAEFRKAISANPDAIVVMGHPGYDALAPLFEDAASKGILVTLANVDIPELREKYWFTGYVGQNLYQSGYLLAKEALKRYPDRLKPGTRVAIFSGSWEQPARALRARGVEDAFKEAGLIVDRVSHPPEVYGSPSEGISYVTSYLASHPDVVLICFDGGGTTATAEDYMKAAGKQPGEIIIIGFDLTPGSVKGLKDGYVQLVIDQQPYLQGFLTVLNLVLSKKYLISGLYIDTGGAIVDKDTVGAVEKLVEEGYR
ncbi:MAG: substrate-binding domain-containing protein [Desulfurococcales archaeon]|nr:substrate-binding domain-containing protein [Desulfurococcales archaeon]